MPDTASTFEKWERRLHGGILYFVSPSGRLHRPREVRDMVGRFYRFEYVQEVEGGEDQRVLSLYYPLTWNKEHWSYNRCTTVLPEDSENYETVYPVAVLMRRERVEHHAQGGSS